MNALVIVLSLLAGAGLAAAAVAVTQLRAERRRADAAVALVERERASHASLLTQVLADAHAERRDLCDRVQAPNPIDMVDLKRNRQIAELPIERAPAERRPWWSELKRLEGADVEDVPALGMVKVRSGQPGDIAVEDVTYEQLQAELMAQARGLQAPSDEEREREMDADPELEISSLSERRHRLDPDRLG